MILKEVKPILKGRRIFVWFRDWFSESTLIFFARKI